MTYFDVTEAKVWHCGAIIRRLRSEHKAAVAWLGLNSHREIRDKFDASSFSRAWWVDGKLSGLGGIMGSALSTSGFVWLALTEEAAAHPYAVAREATRQMAEIMQAKHVLRTTLIPEDRTALRFATRLGFEIEHPTPIPVGRGCVLSVIFARRGQIAA
jgi:hypothetical protein